MRLSVPSSKPGMCHEFKQEKERPVRVQKNRKREGKKVVGVEVSQGMFCFPLFSFFRWIEISPTSLLVCGNLYEGKKENGRNMSLGTQTSLPVYVQSFHIFSAVRPTTAKRENRRDCSKGVQKEKKDAGGMQKATKGGAPTWEPDRDATTRSAKGREKIQDAGLGRHFLLICQWDPSAPPSRGTSTGLCRGQHRGNRKDRQRVSLSHRWRQLRSPCTCRGKLP